MNSSFLNVPAASIHKSWTSAAAWPLDFKAVWGPGAFHVPTGAFVLYSMKKRELTDPFLLPPRGEAAAKRADGAAESWHGRLDVPLQD